MLVCNDTLSITVGARSSKLSQIQVQEVLAELQTHSPDVDFEVTQVESLGDRNLKKSLRTLGKTDFFTRDIDRMVLKKVVTVGIHSAKDLPEPLATGLRIIAITKGVDSTDSLILPEGVSLETLPANAKVASSSPRREEAVQSLRPDLTFVDVRGSVLSRIEQMKAGDFDALVVAEAALIRLGLTELNRITLPGETTPLQGQLAIVARADDRLCAELFASIDVR